jgi:hypothetical protein
VLCVSFKRVERDGGHGGPPHWGILNYGKCCPSPDARRRASASAIRGEGKKEPGFFAAAALNDTKKKRSE